MKIKLMYILPIIIGLIVFLTINYINSENKPNQNEENHSTTTDNKNEEDSSSNTDNQTDENNKIYDNITFEDKPNIYLFWGDGCGHCENLKTYLDSLSTEYKDIYKLNMFEVWSNENNNDFMYLLADHFDESPRGVPYLIIGNKTFNGYSSSYDDEILSAINNLKTIDYDAYERILNDN